LAAELRDSFDVEATLVGGGNGIFDVHVDGTLVYSKFETGRFPEVGEVAEKVRGL